MEQHSQYGPPQPDFETMVYGPAVGCANNPGMCDIDELMGLARGKMMIKWCLRLFVLMSILIGMKMHHVMMICVIICDAVVCVC